MSSKLTIESKVTRLVHYIENMEKGAFRVPAFQRDSVWTIKDRLALFDSL